MSGDMQWPTIEAGIHTPGPEMSCTHYMKSSDKGHLDYFKQRETLFFVKCFARHFIYSLALEENV